jgi:hypothetical protein
MRNAKIEEQAGQGRWLLREARGWTSPESGDRGDRQYGAANAGVIAVTPRVPRC